MAMAFPSVHGKETVMQPPIDTRGWPPGLVEIASRIGAEAALKLAREYGGVRLYVPQTMRSGHPIARLIGPVAAQALCDWRPGEQLELPTLYAMRAKKAMIIKAEGSNRAIARSLGVSERYVRLVRNAGRTRDDEPDLFE
jgi:hypothetical protein